ncbi:hypothetical protein MMC10_011440 [Thelotrema lepadinum]|nr:hypothetical protein [Thelotrema lepadinum]
MALRRYSAFLPRAADRGVFATVQGPIQRVPFPLVRRYAIITKGVPSLDSSTDPVITEDLSPAITRLTLNRPGSLNALSAPLISSLAAALRRVDKLPARRIVILQGAGHRAFCAGADLKESLAPHTHAEPELRRSLELLQEITAIISGPSSRLVSIAAVQGYAIGGGAEMALGSDFIIVDPTAQFWFPEVELGYGVTGAVTARLAASIGVMRAKEMLLMGRRMGAEEGLRVGLLTEVANDPKARALELALQLEKKPELALKSAKIGVEKAVFARQEEILSDEVIVASLCMRPKNDNDVLAGRRLKQGAGSRANASEMINESLRLATNEERARKPISEARDLNRLLQEAAANVPMSLFLRLGQMEVTYTSFFGHIQALARGFISRGVAPGDRVLVMMRNSIEMIETWFATNWIGAVWVPINCEMRSETLKSMMKLVSAKLVIADSEFRDTILDLGVVQREILYINDSSEDNSSPVLPDRHVLSSLFDSSSQILKPFAASPSYISTLLFTSGTTGPSKACSLSHEYFISAAESLSNALGFRRDDVLFCPFPLSHIDGMALTIVPALRLGATAAMSKRFSVSRFWHEIRESRATVYDFMGGTLALLHKAPANDLDTQHNVRLAWGVPLSASWTEAYEQRFGHRLYQVYGSSESGLPISQDGTQDPSRLRVLGSCGRVQPGYEMCIADTWPPSNSIDIGETSIKPVPAGTAGQLLIRSRRPSGVFEGYFANNEATASAFRQGWVLTGDICCANEEGEVFFVGRTKEMIRRMGENVSCAEVEEEFLNHPIVKETAARGIKSPLGEVAEEALKILVVLKEENQSRVNIGEVERELWDWAKKSVSRPHIPDVIQVVDFLARTSTGKIDRSLLPEQGGMPFFRQ